jgi:folate-binding protein YgfZ
MTAGQYILLEDRGVLAMGGPEARTLLQGLVSNDIEKVGPDQAMYATLLTAQGKFLHDFFIAAHGDTLLFDCEGPRLGDLQRRLMFYRLRADATIDDWSEQFMVVAVVGDGARAALGLETSDAAVFRGGVAFADPRTTAPGARVILPREGGVAALEAVGLNAGDHADYDRLRLDHALPDGSRDIVVEKGFLIENGIDDLGGVDFDKGCYVGQELTARTKHRGKVKRHLYRVDIDGPTPASGSAVTFDGRDAGEMRSSLDGVGLALLRIEAVEKALGTALECDGARLTPVKPAWASY